MSIGQDVRKLLKSVPDWGKWLGGLVALATAIGVVLARPRPVILAAVVVAELAALYACWSVLTRKAAPKEGEPAVPVHPPRRRRLAGAAIVALLAANAVVLALPRTRDFVYESFVPRPDPADIVIAEFRNDGGTPLRVAERIEESIESRLRAAGMEGLRVVVDSIPIRSDEQADSVAEARRARAVVWGWYDPHGIKMNLHLASSTGLDAPELDEIPLADTGLDSLAITVVRGEVAPAAAFLSLFVLGHLYYEGNDYARGLAAFDAAARALPPSAPISDRSLVHFFRARTNAAALPDSLRMVSPEYRAVICDYAEAIRLKPDFAAAYNNLGVFIAAGQMAHGLDMTVSNAVEGDSTAGCVEGAGIADFSLDALFERARELQPNSAALAYNALALRWKREGRATYTLAGGEIRIDAARFVPEIEALIRADSSMPGPHLLLGVIRFDEGRFDDAARRFTAAASLDRSARTLVNLAQALVGMGREGDARRELEAALRLDPGEHEARLGLAKLAIRARRFADALRQLDAAEVRSGEIGIYAREVAVLLRAQSHFEEGDAGEAQAVLERWLAALPESCDEGDFGCVPRGYTPVQDLVLFLLTGVTGDTAVARAARAAVETHDLDSQRHWFEYGGDHIDGPIDVFLANGTVDFVWNELVARCAGTAPEPVPVAEWGAGGRCLPASPRDRVRATYEVLHRWLDRRLFYRSELAVFGLACPFLYTWDEAAGEWEWEGTILTHLSGASRQATDSLPLERFDGRVLIREAEPEVSYIDGVRVVIRDAAGRERAVAASDPRLRETDGVRLLLRPGEEATIHFEGASLRPGEEAWLEANGFYLPLRREVVVRQPWMTPEHSPSPMRTAPGRSQ